MKVKFGAGKLARYFSVNDKEAITRHLKDVNDFNLKTSKEYADLIFRVLQEVTNIDPKEFFTKEKYNKLAKLADKLEKERDELIHRNNNLANKYATSMIETTAMFEIVKNLSQHLANE